MGNNPSDTGSTDIDIKSSKPSQSQMNLLRVRATRTPNATPTVNCSLSLTSYTSSSTITPMTSSGTPATPLNLPSLVAFPSTSINRAKLTQIVVSDRLSELAACFWRDNIEPSSLQQRLEIACYLWFGMMKNPSIKTIPNIKCRRHTHTNEQLETTALKILDMIGFIVRAVYTANVDLPLLLQKLGHYHTKMGVKIEYYRIMLFHINKTFKHFFPKQYSQIMELAITEVFAYSAQLMTGQDIKILTPLNDLSFLNSLRRCIRHPIGREYLFKYLNHAYCDEMVIFLYLLNEYKYTNDLNKRYMIAQYITKLCISADGCFAVNISYDYRQRILQEMHRMDANVCMNTDFFIDIEDQICRLIMQSYWNKFKIDMKEMYLID